MKLNFQDIPVVVTPHMRDGEGEAHVRKFIDPAMGSVVNLTLPVGSSIGPHAHVGNCEVMYIVSGKGVYTDDDQAYPVEAGMVTYCPENHVHGIANTGDVPLELLGILPDSKESK